MITTTGAPAAASALSRLAFEIEHRPAVGRWARFFGANPLGAEALHAHEHVTAVLRVEKLLTPLSTRGWLVLPTVFADAVGAAEVDFFVLSPTGQAYGLLTQAYTGEHVRADRRAVRAGGYVEQLPAVASQRALRVSELLQRANVLHTQFTAGVVIVGAERMRAPRRSLPLLLSERTLVRTLLKRERQALGADQVRDERLLTPEFWSATPGFDDAAYRRNLRRYRALRRKLALLPLVHVAWRGVILLGALALALGALIFLAHAHPSVLNFPRRLEIHR